MYNVTFHTLSPLSVILGSVLSITLQQCYCHHLNALIAQLDAICARCRRAGRQRFERGGQAEARGKARGGIDRVGAKGADYSQLNVTFCVQIGSKLNSKQKKMTARATGLGEGRGHTGAARPLGNAALGNAAPGNAAPGNAAMQLLHGVWTYTGSSTACMHMEDAVVGGNVSVALPALTRPPPTA